METRRTPERTAIKMFPFTASHVRRVPVVNWKGSAKVAEQDGQGIRLSACIPEVLGSNLLIEVFVVLLSPSEQMSG
jgi:hypothetical protein